MGRRSRADDKSSAGVMADVVGAVGTFCHIESPVLTAHHAVDTAPELPPRMPMQHKTVSSPSRRKSHSRSSNCSSSGSVISPATVLDSPTPLHHDSLDVFIPSSADARLLHEGVYMTVHAGDKTTTNQKQSVSENVDCEPTAFCNVLADGEEFSSNDAGEGLDIVIAVNDDAGDQKLPTLSGCLLYTSPSPRDS